MESIKNRRYWKKTTIQVLTHESTMLMQLSTKLEKFNIDSFFRHRTPFKKHILFIELGLLSHEACLRMLDGNKNQLDSFDFHFVFGEKKKKFPPYLTNCIQADATLTQ